MLKTKIIPMRPMNIKPLVSIDNSVSSMSSFGLMGGSKTLPDASKMPPPTQKELENYRRNHEQIVGSIVVSSLKRHRRDVLHGSRSLQMLIPKYSREPKDWDIYSPTEKSRAQAIEKALDKKVGGNIAETVYVPIPKISAGPDQPGTSKDLYRVVTPDVSNDAEVDIMNRPAGLKTISHKGITHESLEEAYIKADRSVRTQPMRMAKASVDKQNIESYFKKKGKILKTENPTSISWL